MRVETKRSIHLDDADKCDLIAKARDIDQGISKDEYIEHIESFVWRVVDLLESKDVGHGNN